MIHQTFAQILTCEGKIHAPHHSLDTERLVNGSRVTVKWR